MALLLVLLAPARPAPSAMTVDGHEWPPDPARYEPAGTVVVPGLAIGDTLGRENAECAKDALPPEVLRHYRQGHYRNRVVSWPEGLMHWDKEFEDATGSNIGKLELSREGAIIDKATDKQPGYIYGFPFPGLTDGDPRAGLKAVWNSLYAWWANGDGWFDTVIVWVSPQGVDRQVGIDARYHWYTAQAPKYRRPNPQNLISQAYGLVLNPADLQGTATLNYRYWDPTKRDTNWTYVPALRRVRQISPSNRSDGFLGSDISQDDGHFFDAKPEDFQWKTVGLREGLRIVDPESVKGNGGRLAYVRETDGFRTTWDKDIPAAGYMVKDWKGIAWAPVSAALAKRRFWVVEGVPNDRYYLYGRVELWIDAETWQGAWNRKFSWKGELLNTYQLSSYLNHPAQRPGDSDIEWFWSSQHDWRAAENLPLDRATITGLRLSLTAPLDRRVRHDVQRVFDLDSLSRGSK